MKKVGVVLAGCGVMDGAEIHESVLTMLVLELNGAEAVLMAPDMEQAHVINHLTQAEMKEKRNVLVEAARIARGKIKDIKTVKAGDLDALIFPGGFGVAKNLCTIAFNGIQGKVHPEIIRLAKEVRAEKKPIGAACIAPALVAKIFEGEKLKLTIGDDPETVSLIEALGHVHIRTNVREVCEDETHRIYTTPAYMSARNLEEVYASITQLVKTVLGKIKN